MASITLDSSFCSLDQQHDRPFQRKRSLMTRRGAVVSHSVRYKSKSERIELNKSTKRKVVRRYAITKYSRIPLNFIKSLRKTTFNDHDDDESIGDEYIPRPSLNNNKVIVFDENDEIDLNYKGSSSFITIVRMYYREKYNYAETDTHRSIIRSAILDELKGRRYNFIKIVDLVSEKAIILDDYEALGKIVDRIKYESKRRRAADAA